MSEDTNQRPDHTLAAAEIEPGGEGPQIFAVSDLRAYVKPDLDEELGQPQGGGAVCGTEVVCTCVPVETCVCNTVTYHVGGCTCTCTGTCAGLYWFPY